jgi:hypothetical protein
MLVASDKRSVFVDLFTRTPPMNAQTLPVPTGGVLSERQGAWVAGDVDRIDRYRPMHEVASWDAARAA